MSESTRLEMTLGNTGDPFIYSSIDEAEAAIRDTYAQNNWPLPELHGRELLDALDDVEYTMHPEIRIEYPTQHSDYFLHYQIQTQPQPSGIEIDPENTVLRCYVNGGIDTIPEDVYNYRKIWIRISNTDTLTVEEMSGALDLIKDFAQVICDGYSTHYRNGNWIGEYTKKALSMLEKIEKALWENDINYSGTNLPEVW